MQQNSKSSNLNSRNDNLKDNTSIHKQILDYSDIIVLVFDIDGNLIISNRYFHELTGFKEDIKNKNWKQVLVSLENNDLLLEDFNFESLIKSSKICRIFNREGKPIEIEWKASEIHEEDNHEKLILLLGYNVSKLIDSNNKLEESLKKLAESEERYKLVAEGSNDGFWDLNFNTGSIFVSQRCLDMLGYDDYTAFDNFKKAKSLVHPEDLPLIISAIRKHIYKKTPFYQSDIRVKTNRGNYKWLMCRGKALRSQEDRPLKIVSSMTDISERKNSEEKIRMLAFNDMLTGLNNRFSFELELSEYVTKCVRNSSSFSLINIDLDNFKTINDTIGHEVGDSLLRAVSDILLNILRDKDILSRTGGDEFNILLPDVCSINDLSFIANRIMDKFLSPIIISGYEINVTLSLGIAVFPKDGNDEVTLMKNVDTALYKAKELGKNNYQFFSREMNKQLVERISLERDLRHAIKNKEFLVYYQPKISLNNGEITGMEALIRWKHPELGLIPPSKFIPAAEETGLIVPIGEFVLKTASEQIAQWIRKGYRPIKIAINLSARQFHQPNLFEKLESIIFSSGIDPAFLEVEITESTAMNDFEFTNSVLKKLKSIGINVALDDFGTGYSSLNYLKQFPINVLKIDKSFVDGITTTYTETEIAKVIITLAHVLNLTIVAEGVESKFQLDFLKSQRCDEVQGYYFCKPMPAEECEKLLKSEKKFL